MFRNIYLEGGALICWKYKSQINKNFEKSSTQNNEIWSLVETC